MACSDCDKRVKKVINMWIWICILAFVVGCFMAGKYYQKVSNEFIIENCIETNPMYEVCDDGSYTHNLSHPEVRRKLRLPVIDTGTVESNC